MSRLVLLRMISIALGRGSDRRKSGMVLGLDSHKSPYSINKPRPVLQVQYESSPVLGVQVVAFRHLDTF